MGSSNTLTLARAAYPYLANVGNFTAAASGGLTLLGLLVYVVWKARQKRKPWVPCNSLVLSALTLTLFHIFNPSISKLDNFNSIENVCFSVYADRAPVIFGRLALCAFIGYLLPFGAARNGRWDEWQDVIALLLIAAVPFYQVISEMYDLLVTNFCQCYVFGDGCFRGEVCKYASPSVFSCIQPDERGTWIVATDAIFFVSVLLLLGHVICARIACLSLQEMIDLRKPILLNPLRIEVPGVELKPHWNWNLTKENLIKLWIVGRTWQPAYVVTRSVLSTSTALVVSFYCIISTLQFKAIGDNMKPYLFGSDPYTFCSEMALCASRGLFVASAWTVICLRWIQSSAYNPRFLGVLDLKRYSHHHSADFDFWKFIRMEDFWLRGLQELQEDPRFSEKDGDKALSTCLGRMAKAFRLYKLTCILVVLQMITVAFSKLCWLASELVFPHQLMGIIIMGYRRFQEFSVLCGEIRIKRTSLRCISNRTSHSFNVTNLDFHRFSNNLLYLEGENPVGIWTANLASVSLLERSMNEAMEKGKTSKELRRLLLDSDADFESSKSLVEKYLAVAAEHDVYIARKFELKDNSLKMTSVSLLAVIIELANFYKLVFPNSTETQQDIIESYIKDCDQAWKIMELVESTKEEGSRVSKAADNVFKGLKQSKKGRHWLGHPLPSSRDRTAVGEDTENGRAILKDMEAAVENLRVMAKEEADGKQNSGDGGGLDTRNWNKVTAGGHLSRVCEELLRSSRRDGMNEMEFLKEPLQALEAVVMCSVWKVKESFNELLRIWSRPGSLCEDEIWEASNVMAFTVGVCATD